MRSWLDKLKHEIRTGIPSAKTIREYGQEHPSDCRYCQAGEPYQHNYEPPEDD